MRLARTSSSLRRKERSEANLLESAKTNATEIESGTKPHKEGRERSLRVTIASAIRCLHPLYIERLELRLAQILIRNR
jgi:hypothetical protein